MTQEPRTPPDNAVDLRRLGNGRETLAMLTGIFEAARLIPVKAPSTTGSLPLTVISGFLGAGKTTLVNRILTEPHGRRIAVLVNDFGALNIDEELIRSRNEDTIGLANGCACCSVAGDLTKALLRLLQRPDPPDAIVLEASGLADPHGIAQVALANPAIRLDGVLTLVDGETFLDRINQADILPTILSQLMAADLVVLNKTDLIQGDRNLVRSRLEEFAGPRAIVEVEQANVPIDVVLGIHAKRTSGFQCTVEGHASSFLSSTFSWDVPLDRARVTAALRQLPAHVIRAKGFFHFVDDPEHRSVYQRVGRRENLETEGMAASPPHSRLVIIGLSAAWRAEEINRHFAGLASRHGELPETGDARVIGPT
jgi:G3E family GTPase